MKHIPCDIDKAMYELKRCRLAAFRVFQWERGLEPQAASSAHDQGNSLCGADPFDAPRSIEVDRTALHYAINNDDLTAVALLRSMERIDTPKPAAFTEVMALIRIKCASRTLVETASVGQGDASHLAVTSCLL